MFIIHSVFVLSIVELFSLVARLIMDVCAILHLPIIVVIRAVRKAFPLFFLLFPKQLCLIVGLIIYLFENWESFLRGHASLSFQDVDHDAVGPLLNSLPRETGLLGQSFLVAQVFLVTQVINTVKELASLSIHAVAILMVLGAHFGLIVGWQVLFWHELVHIVCV